MTCESRRANHMLVGEVRYLVTIIKEFSQCAPVCNAQRFRSDGNSTNDRIEKFIWTVRGRTWNRSRYSVAAGGVSGVNSLNDVSRNVSYVSRQELSNAWVQLIGEFLTDVNPDSVYQRTQVVAWGIG